MVARAAAVAIAGVLAVFASPGSAQEPAPEEPAEAPSAEATAAETTSETFQVGPFDLAPRGQDGDQINRLGDVVPRPDGDIAVRGITWRFVDENGDDISSHMAHLHHMVLLDSGRPDQLCAYPPASRFAATGKELTDLMLPEGYAYHSPAGAPWFGVYHVMNMSDQRVRAAIEYTVTYAEAGDDLLDVEPYFLDVDGCWGDSEYPVPGDGGPGSVHQQSTTYTMTREGYFLGAGGHVHDGGIDIVLDGPDGEVCRSTAVYEGHGHERHLVEITPCALEEQFTAGDRYTLTARYENHQPIPGAMGIMLGYIHHTDPPPPVPEVGVELGGLTRDGLQAHVTCAYANEVTLDAYVSQQKGNTPAITGWGYTTVPCEDGTVTLPLGGQGGVLTGGDVTVELYAEAFSGGRSAFDLVFGSAHLTGRLDLTDAAAPTTGQPISIDGQTVATGDGQAVTGTVHCDTPGDVWVWVDGKQRVGRHVVPFSGSEAVACDGTTVFSVPVTSWDGRLAAGRSTVSVYVYDDTSFEDVATASATVRLHAERPQAETLPPADDSPLALVGAERTDGGVAVTVSYADCPAGAYLYVDAQVRSVQGPGRRVPAGDQWTWSQAICDGGDVTLVLPAVDARGHRVAVEAYASVETPDDWQSAWTWGELTVGR
jgi:hypothetical protein